MEPLTICRLCAGAKSDSDIISSISDIEDENLTLNNYIGYYCHIELNCDPNLPQKVCRVCRLLLEAFIAFTDNLKKAEIRLTNANPQVNKIYKSEDAARKQEGEEPDAVKQEPNNVRDPGHVQYRFKTCTKDKTSMENVEDLFAEWLQQSIFNLEQFSHITVDREFVSESGEISSEWLDTFGVSSWKDYSYTCQECKKTFKSLRSMMNHLIESCGKKTKICCKICDRQCSAMNSYINHVITAHDFQHLSFCCVRCSKFFYNIASLIKHYKRSHPLVANIFPCLECGYYALNITALKTHVLSHTTQELSDESEADEDDNSSSKVDAVGALEKSRVSNQNKRRSDYKVDPNKPKRPRVPRFPCKHCNKVLLTKQGLVYHNLVHSDSQPHMVSSTVRSLSTTSKATKTIQKSVASK